MSGDEVPTAINTFENMLQRFDAIFNDPLLGLKIDEFKRYLFMEKIQDQIYSLTEEGTFDKKDSEFFIILFTFIFPHYWVVILLYYEVWLKIT